MARLLRLALGAALMGEQKARLERKLSSLARTLALLAIAACLASVAVGFLIAALFLWLETLWPAPLAALVTGAGFLVLAGAMALAASGRRRHRRHRRHRPGTGGRDPGDTDPGAEAAEVMAESLDGIRRTVSRSPKTGLTLAMVAGLIVGTILKDR